MSDKIEDLTVICINDKDWPDTIPKSHRLEVHKEYQVLRITSNHMKQTKLVLKDYEDLDLVTGGRFDGYSKGRFIPTAVISEVWNKNLKHIVELILSKPYDGIK